ncbi:hypothetical protein LTR53_003952 [Teratosphaeriaceae sp. CCFEE 6253]|nr:hypothetical protein LTR53_003952 [Teratosphaeriaceae sp. CCFEE 6253]
MPAPIANALVFVTYLKTPQEEAKNPATQKLVRSRALRARHEATRLSSDRAKEPEEHRYHFRPRSVTLGAEAGWFSFFASDAAIAQASLAFISLNRDLAGGRSASKTTLLCKAKAIQMTHQMLAKRAVDMLEVLVGAVSLLLTMESLEVDFENAAAHMLGLTELVKLCGGVDTLNKKDPQLARILGWADLSFSCTWSQAPHLPWVYTTTHSVRESHDLADSEWTAFRNELSCLIGLDSLQVIDLLHALPVEPVKDSSSEDERHRNSQSVYVLERSLLERLHAQQDEDMPPYFLLFSYASLIFISLALRDLPVHAERLQIVASLLKQEMGKVLHADQLGSTPRSALILLLWASMIHLATSLRGNMDHFIIASLRAISSELNIDSVEELKDSLRLITWPEGFLESVLARLL